MVSHNQTAEINKCYADLLTLRGNKMERMIDSADGLVEPDVEPQQSKEYNEIERACEGCRVFFSRNQDHYQ